MRELSVFSAKDDLRAALSLLERSALGGDRSAEARALPDLAARLASTDGHAALCRLAERHGIAPEAVPGADALNSLLNDVLLSDRALALHGGRDIYSGTKLRLWQQVWLPFHDALMPAAEVVDVLATLVAMDTSPGGDGAPACVDFLATTLRSYGFQIELERGADGDRPLLYATRPARDMAGRIVLYGHYDSDLLREDEWTSPPLSLTERGGRLYGAGVGDNKGALAARLCALGPAHRCPEILWILQGDEETGSALAHQRLRARMPGQRATLWLEENGYHDADGTQRILARIIDGDADARAEQPPERDATGGFSDLIDRLGAVDRRFGLGWRVEVRGLNKDFFAGGCPWGRNLPDGARYLAIGVNDPASGIHAANESVPMWTFAVHAAQIEEVMRWVDEQALEVSHGTSR